MVKPFKVDIPQADLDDLTQRLKNTRWPDDANGWHNGTSLTYMEKLVDYWQHKYDWRKQEAQINELPQFTAEIDGVTVHFVHQKSKKAGAKALVLVHGWPDSFYRFHKVVPMLAEEYDVIVPSLPGFGFSSRTPMASAKTADLFVKLITKELGYKTFLAVGGDLGTGVVKAFALNYQDAVEAIHLTDADYPTGQEDASTLSKAEQDFMNKAQWWSMSEGAYLFVNGNKPQSLAYGLNDSPAGLAAWILSFVNGGNEQDVAEAAFGSRDELLTNIMIYWLTQTAGSAARMYRENALATYGGDWGAPAEPKTSKVPAAFAVFPGELEFPKEWAARQGFNVKRYEKMPKGGHFAALEVPELYVKDLRDAFSEMLG